MAELEQRRVVAQPGGIQQLGQCRVTEGLNDLDGAGYALVVVLAADFRVVLDCCGPFLGLLGDGGLVLLGLFGCQLGLEVDQLLGLGLRNIQFLGQALEFAQDVASISMPSGRVKSS